MSRESTLDPKQHLLALKKANDTYSQRAAVKRRMKAGELSLLDALKEPCCQSARIETMVKAQKGFGDAKTFAFLSRLSWKYRVAIAPSRRVRDLTKDQLAALRKALQ